MYKSCLFILKGLWKRKVILYWHIVSFLSLWLLINGRPVLCYLNVACVLTPHWESCDTGFIHSGFRFRPLFNFQEFWYQGLNFCTVSDKLFIYFYLFMVYLTTLSVDDYVTLVFEKINFILLYRNSYTALVSHYTCIACLVMFSSWLNIATTGSIFQFFDRI